MSIHLLLLFWCIVSSLSHADVDADGYGRCDPCPDHYIGNGVCDGPPGWVQPGTGICATGTDPDVVDDQPCDGNINTGGDSGQGGLSGSDSLFQLGQSGFQDCECSIRLSNSFAVFAIPLPSLQFLCRLWNSIAVCNFTETFFLCGYTQVTDQIQIAKWSAMRH